MVLSVGTFNLNNLFSRFNYEAEVSELPEEDADISSSTTFPVSDPDPRFAMDDAQENLSRHPPLRRGLFAERSFKG